MDTAEVLHVPEASAADRAYAHVKAGILARRYPPRGLLTEGEIADAVGVSRTPVREALLRLQAEQLVQLLPKRGALVLAVTTEEAADVMETRRLVETFAVRKAVAGATDDLVADLDGLIGRMRSAMDDHDAAQYVAADRDFHERIVAATGNEIIISLYRSLRDKQLRMGVVNLLDEREHSGDPARMRATLAGHVAIRDAISAGTLRAAQAAVADHLDAAEQMLRRR